jgi:hypothetical protein
VNVTSAENPRSRCFEAQFFPPPSLSFSQLAPFPPPLHINSFSKIVTSDAHAGCELLIFMDCTTKDALQGIIHLSRPGLWQLLDNDVKSRQNQSEATHPASSLP